MDAKRQARTDAIHEAFVNQLDPFMKEHGFKRIKKSLIYRREAEYGVQTLSSNQYYGRIGIACWVESFLDRKIFFQTARDVFKEEKFLKHVEKIAESMTYFKRIRLEWESVTGLIPMPERCDYLNFFQYLDLSAIPAGVKTYREIIEKWTLPYMDSHRSLESIEEAGYLHVVMMLYIHYKRYDDALRAFETLELLNKYSDVLEAARFARTEQRIARVRALAQQEGFRIEPTSDAPALERAKAKVQNDGDWTDNDSVAFNQTIKEYIVAHRQ